MHVHEIKFTIKWNLILYCPEGARYKCSRFCIIRRFTSGRRERPLCSSMRCLHHSLGHEWLSWESPALVQEVIVLKRNSLHQMSFRWAIIRLSPNWIWKALCVMILESFQMNDSARKNSTLSEHPTTRHQNSQRNSGNTFPHLIFNICTSLMQTPRYQNIKTNKMNVTRHDTDVQFCMIWWGMTCTLHDQ